MSELTRRSKPQPVSLILLAILISAALGCCGYLVAIRSLEHRERVLARRDVSEYLEKHRGDLRELRANPLVYQLEVDPVPGDDTRVRIRFDVENVETFRQLEERFADVDLERFPPVWETTLRNKGALSQEPHVVVLAAGAHRGYATRSTLSGGVAGIAAGTVFSLMWFWFFRRPAEDGSSPGGSPN